MKKLRSLRVALLSAAILIAGAAALLCAGPATNPHCIDSRQFIKYTAGWSPEVRKAMPPETTPLGPPGGPYTIGQSWQWYITHLQGMPWAELKSCTIRGISAHAYLVVEDSAWGSGLGQVDQADVDIILDYFENTNFTANPTSGGIYPQAVEAFGDPPLGLDGDQMVFLLYYDFDVSSDGFFWIFDTEPNGANPPFNSNECEVVYLNCGWDSGVDHTPSGEYMLGVLAHEFEHLIHYAYDPNEASWVDEGLAEYAMFRFGADDPGWIADFLSDPDVGVIPPAMQGVHYGAVWFFTVYLAGHYGGPPFTYALVHNPAVGITGIDSTLASFGSPDTFEDVFKKWTVANLVDDPSIGSGEYGYADYDFAPIAFSNSHSSHPLSSTAASVNLWAADYIQLLNYSSIQVAFDGRDTDRFALSLVEIDQQAVLGPKVRTVTPDALQQGTFDVFSSSGYEEAVLIPAAMTPGASLSLYSYSTAATAVPLVLKAWKDPAAGLDTVELWWPAGTATYDCYRSFNPATVDDPGSLYQSGVTSPHHLTGQTDPAIYYSIQSR